jgi:hypothetical protein
MDAEGWEIVYELARKREGWAIQMVSHYAYGKPRERVEHSGPDGGPLTFGLNGNGNGDGKE